MAEQVVTNPYPTPLKVQLSQPTTLLLLTTEKWANRNWPYPCSTDPFSVGNPDPPTGTTCEELSPPLFSTPTARTGQATNSQTPLALDVVTSTPISTASTAATIQAYDAVTLARIEIMEGALVVPAATSTTPSKILVRLGRPGPWARAAPNLAPLANSANCNTGSTTQCKWTDASQIFVRKDGFIWDQPTFYPRTGFKHIAEWIIALSSIDESLSGQLRYSISSLVAGSPASVRRDVDWNFSEVISH